VKSDPVAPTDPPGISENVLAVKTKVGCNRASGPLAYESSRFFLPRIAAEFRYRKEQDAVEAMIGMEKEHAV
jgi:hypothetical protein